MKMNVIELKKSFSERLYAEFQRMALPMNSPTEIARVLNRKVPQLSVTPQTVRKWLFHGSYPSQDKMVLLAGWLGVSAQWLRFGEGERLNTHQLSRLSADHGVPIDLLLLRAEYAALIPVVHKLAKLSAKEVHAVACLVDALLASGC